MVDITIPREYELDWDDIAIDDGTITLKAPKYSYVLETFDGTQEITGQVESIRYSPEINSAPSITIDIPPRDNVDGVTFLGGELTVYINGDFLFNGDIVVIDTSEKEGDSSSIKARSKGKKIDGDIVDERPQNIILQDFLAKTIDKANEYDAEAVDIAGTADEELTNIEKVDEIIRRPSGISGTVRYNNVGSDASDIDIIYVKATVDTSLDISILSGTTTLYNQTVSALEFGTYGTWFPLFPDITSTDSYDIEFTLEGSGTILYDWISLTEDKIKREVLPFQSEVLEENLVLQGASTTSEFEEISELKDTDPVTFANNKIELLQTCFWIEGTDYESSGGRDSFVNEDFSGVSGDDCFGSAVSFSEDNVGESAVWQFTIDYEWPAENWDLYLRYAGRVDESGFIDVEYTVNGQNPVERSPGTNEDVFITERVYESENVEKPTLEPGTHTIEATVSDAPGKGRFWIDSIAPHDTRFSYNFDNSVTCIDGTNYLDGPEMYPREGFAFRANQTLADTNITSVRMNTDYNSVDGNQFIQLSFDGGESFIPSDGSQNDTQSLSINKESLGISVDSRANLAGFPLDNSPRNDTPRYGYNGHEINSWTIDVDTDDVEILFDQEFNDNRLATVSNLADLSNHFFRWEGDVCRIFKQGTQKTNVDLKEEDITSTTDIEDTYSSVQVIGRNGIRSPVIESDNAPAYVNRHKEIRDRDIESEQDARRRALEFISDNGEIIYEGDIDTLPTRAPLGEEMDGEIFSHGKDMFIERVNYSKRSSSISLGRRRDLGKEIMQLERSKRSSEILDTT